MREFSFVITDTRLGAAARWQVVVRDLQCARELAEKALLDPNCTRVAVWENGKRLFSLPDGRVDDSGGESAVWPVARPQPPTEPKKL